MDGSKSFADIIGAMIDAEGRFKYIQIQIENKKTQESKTIVMGWNSCGYHADIMEKFMQEELNECDDSEDVHCFCPGGGRIEHTGPNKLSIFGYSQSYGQANH